jgi:hypothetical protein
MSESKDYEVAVEKFQAADKKYQELAEKFLSGDWMPPEMKKEHQTLRDQVRSSLEDRNAERIAAANALRQAVVLGPTQWRGAEGKTTVVAFGPFNCSSVTKRTFDAKSLLDGAQKHGLLERLLELKSRDKDGVEYKLVEQVWKIDYDGISSWLKAHKLTDVLEGAYDEKESTPTVKGPKLLAFLGDEKDK